MGKSQVLAPTVIGQGAIMVAEIPPTPVSFGLTVTNKPDTGVT
jgi:hypothetical protein